nr:hypothetical protein [uncultured bacterium]
MGPKNKTILPKQWTLKTRKHRSVETLVELFGQIAQAEVQKKQMLQTRKSRGSCHQTKGCLKGGQLFPWNKIRR